MAHSYHHVDSRDRAQHQAWWQAPLPAEPSHQSALPSCLVELAIIAGQELQRDQQSLSTMYVPHSIGSYFTVLVMFSDAYKFKISNLAIFILPVLLVSKKWLLNLILPSIFSLCFSQKFLDLASCFLYATTVCIYQPRECQSTSMSPVLVICF